MMNIVLTVILGLSLGILVRLWGCKTISVEALLKENNPIKVGFFHPYCDTCGGGERVLWLAILTLANLNENIKFIIYSRLPDNDDLTREVLEKAGSTFHLPELNDVKLQKRVQFVQLRSVKLLESQLYPRLTLLAQSFGSIIVTFEGFLQARCDIFIDSTGFAFSFPVFSLFAFINLIRSGERRQRSMAYVHYPTISTDMLNSVASGEKSFNNSESISSSRMKTGLKLGYYKVFSWMYCFAGSFCNSVSVNSSWTKNHIDSIWKVKSTLIFPPCNVSATSPRNKRDRTIISLGQFRPEKNHSLQLQIYSKLNEMCKKKNIKCPKFLLIGGCRGEDDFKRVKKLKDECKELGLILDEQVEFRLNESFADLKVHLSNALIGVHTMKNEHFGIAPVEMQSYGVLVVAHNSGGPKLDIIDETNKSRNGFLAETCDEFADSILSILEKFDDGKEHELNLMRSNGFLSSQRFSDASFRSSFEEFFKSG